MELLKTYSAEIIIGLIVLVVLQWLFVMALSARLTRTTKLVRGLLTGPEGEDLEVMLREVLAESSLSRERSDELEQRISGVATQMRGCVQRIGLVRYDAYGDVSGEQSFSMALLDGLNNGAIMTGLFGRTDSRCYGKAVVDGRTSQALSEEEEQALEMALSGGIAVTTLEQPSSGTALSGIRSRFKSDSGRSSKSS